MTEKERKIIQNIGRGRRLTADSWRNYCCQCSMPMAVPESDSKRKNLTCEHCAMQNKENQRV